MKLIKLIYDYFRNNDRLNKYIQYKNIVQEMSYYCNFTFTNKITQKAVSIKFNVYPHSIVIYYLGNKISQKIKKDLQEIDLEEITDMILIDLGIINNGH